MQSNPVDTLLQRVSADQLSDLCKSVALLVQNFDGTQDQAEFFRTVVERAQLANVLPKIIALCELENHRFLGTRISPSGTSRLEIHGNLTAENFVGRDVNNINNFNINVRDDHRVAGIPNPYRGLEPYDVGDTDIFAGRDEDVKQAIRKLTMPGQEQTIFFIVGASGSGKSSFTRAGLIPALRKVFESNGTPFRFAVMRPQSKPLSALDQATRILDLPSCGPAQNLLADWNPFDAKSNKRMAGDDAIRLLVIDQFEELFNVSDPKQAHRFMEIIESVPSFASARSYIVCTLRSDFISALFPRAALYKLATNGAELRTMKPTEVEAAIVKPLSVVAGPGVKEFDPSLLPHGFGRRATAFVASDFEGDLEQRPFI
jgi:hypothetical protein